MGSKITNTGSLDSDQHFRPGATTGKGFRAVVAFSFLRNQQQLRVNEKSGRTRSMELQGTAIFPEEK
jgi:hypothetical protein